ncbi:MAG: IS200/IS605 family transposase [bacterium]
MGEYIHKSHNVAVLLYHLVCPAKYRRVAFSPEVDQTLKNTCIEISKRFEIRFLEIGTDKDHVHFLIQTIPAYAPSELVKKIKSITAREIFKIHPEVKQKLWGGQFWSDGYFLSTVGQKGNEQSIAQYVKNQGKETQYIKLYQEASFDTL